MKARINKIGNLELERVGEWKQQWCPYGPARADMRKCGDWCPQFQEGQVWDKPHDVAMSLLFLACGQSLGADQRVAEDLREKPNAD